jgi:hypothetical protein
MSVNGARNGQMSGCNFDKGKKIHQAVRKVSSRFPQCNINCVQIEIPKSKYAVKVQIIAWLYRRHYEETSAVQAE